LALFKKELAMNSIYYLFWKKMGEIRPTKLAPQIRNLMIACETHNRITGVIPVTKTQYYPEIRCYFLTA